MSGMDFNLENLSPPERFGVLIKAVVREPYAVDDTVLKQELMKAIAFLLHRGKGSWSALMPGDPEYDEQIYNKVTILQKSLPVPDKELLEALKVIMGQPNYGRDSLIHEAADFVRFWRGHNVAEAAALRKIREEDWGTYTMEYLLGRAAYEVLGGKVPF